MMNNSLNNFVMLAIGAVIGSAVTWKITKTKYERIAQEEIDSVKKVFSVKKDNNKTEEKEEENIIVDNETKNEYAAKIKECGYSSEEEDEEYMEKPYVISPDEYDELGYKTVSLEYFEDDGVLLDERGKIIKNAKELIGIDPSDHFGEYEEDSVFVRNDRLKTDYEILKCKGCYSEEY